MQGCKSPSKSGPLAAIGMRTLWPEVKTMVRTQPPGSRTDGSWRHLAEALLKQVDFGRLQEEVRLLEGWSNSTACSANLCASTLGHAGTSSCREGHPPALTL